VIELINCEPENVQNKRATCPTKNNKNYVEFKLGRIPRIIVLAFLLDFFDKHVPRDLLSD